MIWLTWRQHRSETLISAGLFAALAALLIPTGLSMLSDYHTFGVSACLGSTRSSQHCFNAIHTFYSAAGSLVNLLGWANFLPLVFGVLLAAPFVLDLETGTYRLAWTQSISRTRWVAIKLLLVAGAAVVVGAGLALLFSWWRVPLDHLGSNLDPNDAFDFEGVVPIGYVLFATGLVLALGVLTRRAVVAVGLSLAAFLGARLSIMGYVRPHLMAPVEKVFPASGAPAMPTGVSSRDWVLNNGLSDRLGHPLSNSQSLAAFDRCGNTVHGLPKGSASMQQALAHCFHSDHIYNFTIYQPASRFWSLQLRELALYAVMALILFAFTAWWVRDRVG